MGLMKFMNGWQKGDLITMGNMEQQNSGVHWMVYSTPFSILITECSSKAQELYNPVLDSRAKAERLRATLVILDRHKEYFNLPSLIANNIKRVPLLRFYG